MKDWQSQAHVKWDCKYHVVIAPKVTVTVHGAAYHKVVLNSQYRSLQGIS